MSWLPYPWLQNYVKNYKPNKGPIMVADNRSWFERNVLGKIESYYLNAKHVDPYNSKWSTLRHQNTLGYFIHAHEQISLGLQINPYEVAFLDAGYTHGVDFHFYDGSNQENEGIYEVSGPLSGLDASSSMSLYLALNTKGSSNTWIGDFEPISVSILGLQLTAFRGTNGIIGVGIGASASPIPASYTQSDMMEYQPFNWWSIPDYIKPELSQPNEQTDHNDNR